MLNTMRQEGILHPDKVKGKCITVVGAGAIGSFAVLSLAKLGVQAMRVYDEDGVSTHNLPNQFYRVDDAADEKFKVDALQDIVQQFGDMTIQANKEFYTSQLLEEFVVVGTDSMASRRLVWEQFKIQTQSRHYIEARMGAEVFRMYVISKPELKPLSDKDIKFYEDTLYSDAEADQVPCTARSIVYTVLMSSAFICRAFKAIVAGESWPREVIFNMAQMVEPSLVYMARV